MSAKEPIFRPGPFTIADVKRFVAEPEIRAHLEAIFAETNSWDLLLEYCERIDLGVVEH